MNTEDFKRPDHPDFLTSSELAKTKFSGARENKILDRHEIWIHGECVGSVTNAVLKKDPEAMTRLHLSIFKLTPEPGVKLQ